MAMIVCAKCQKIYSERAKACPACGEDTKGNKDNTPITCKECKKQYGKKAAACAHCGNPTPGPPGAIAIIVFCIVILALGTGLGFIFAGRAIPNASAPPAIDAKVQEEGWMVLGKNQVKAKLKDPESAKFRNVFVHRGQDNIPITCGEVKSKNGFGGYTGYQRFVSGGTSELTFLEEQVADGFAPVWKRFCSSKK